MSHKYPAVAALFFGAALLPHLASAQEGARLQKKELAADGQPLLIEFRAADRPSAADGAFVLREQLGLSQDEQMRPVRLDTDELGFTHQKFNQYYRGVKIEHATYTVHARGGAVESLSGDYERVEKLSVTPGLSASAALGRALAAVGAQKYMWQNAAEEGSLKQQTGNAAATYQPQGELVIVRDFRKDPETGPLVLVWKFDIYAQAPLSRAYYYVHAQTGEVVLRDAIIKHANAPGTASFATAYSGTRALADETVTATGGGYRLREYTRGNGIETYNCKKTTNYAGAVDFTDADNSWTAAEYNNANFDNAAGDAHFGAQATYDYWKAIHNRNSYNNAGAKILSYVHYSSSYENAFWDGTRMTYGDGASTFKPLTALDVCGHEIGHAVCSNTANLTYSYESGALNEGLSDCWGASVEKYTVDKFGLTGAKSTWDIGEEIMKAGGALRSMSNPNLYNQPAYYKGVKWYAGSGDNGGVHYNSGVLNYWYYLISVGKTGTNEVGAAYSVTGLGLTNAAKILFRAESVYLTASSNYAAARTATISAATDLFGATSAQVAAVTNAWKAVGVGLAGVYCTSKGNSIADEYLDYVAIGSIARTSGADGGYYNGTALNINVAAGSSQSISYSAGFTGQAYTEYVKIYADWNQDGDFGDTGETIVNAAGSAAATVRTSTFAVPTAARNGKTRLRAVLSYTASTGPCDAYSYGETEDYSITVTGGTTAPTLDGDDLAATPNALTTTLDARAELSLYPNPAADQLHLSLSSGAELKAVEVLDVRGAKAAVQYLGSGEISVSSLAPGLYLLRATDGQNTFVKHFAKQ